MNKRYLGLIVLLAVLGSGRAQTGASPLVLDISSGRAIDGTAGDFVTIEGQIRDTGNEPVSDITTYLSLVDTISKLPVDLEDWSAERGLYIGTIEPGQTLPLNWKIHFVKAGGYSLTIVAMTAGREMPDVSRIVHFHVNAKHSLDPAHVLPVALGMPVLVAFLLLLLNYRRRVRR